MKTSPFARIRLLMPTLAVCLLCGSAAAQDFSSLEMVETRHDSLKLKWNRPKMDKWYHESVGVGEGRTLVDIITRKESPSASPDMLMQVIAWTHAGGGYAPLEFPQEGDSDLRKIINNDPVLKLPQHEEFMTRLTEAMADREVHGETKMDQKSVLNMLVNYKDEKSNGVKKYGRDLDKIVKLQDKDKYFAKVSLDHRTTSGMMKFYRGAAQYDFTKPRMSGEKKVEVGEFKGKSFTVMGHHKRLGAKVVVEYTAFTGVADNSNNRYTVVIQTFHWGGFEKEPEILAIKPMILASFKETD